MKNDDILKVVKKHKISANELENILKSIENSAPKQIKNFSDYFEERVKIGVFSDCHIGAREFDEPFFKHMVRCFEEEKISRIYNVGDTLEGMSGRDGQIYDLTEIGFNNQFEKALKLFRTFPKEMQIFGIDGNHDEWYQKKNNSGMIVGKELARNLKNYNFLGQDEANVEIGKGIVMKLFHPNDGTAYAVSYKMQKLMESFTGGEKPEVLLQGHYHKALYMFNRNIHGLECGTLCGQTRWMRGKKIAANKGFWIVEMEIGQGGIGFFKPAFYPGYK
jgi:predicted phosphodiesterase